MSTFIQVYRNKSKHSHLFLVLCIGFILLGIVGLLLFFISEKPLIPFLNEASYFVLIFNGAISFWLVWSSMKRAKYFVAWNDREISYLLPKAEKTVFIPIENIKSIDINISEIIIGLKNNETRHFNLNYFFFPERKTITDFFEKLKEANQAVSID
jgi:hypothetical protein